MSQRAMDASEDAREPHPSRRALLGTGIALLALWALSWGLSSMALGQSALPVAIAIAVGKAVLVLLFFMELSGATLSLKLTLVSAAALALTLGGFMVSDVLTRSAAPLAVPGAPAHGQAPLPSR